MGPPECHYKVGFFKNYFKPWKLEGPAVSGHGTKSNRDFNHEKIQLLRLGEVGGVSGFGERKFQMLTRYSKCSSNILNDYYWLGWIIGWIIKP